MAKALLGHVGGPDPRMVSEMRRLQQRIRDLEAELIRLQAHNDALAAQTRDEALSRMQEREPALTESDRSARPQGRLEEASLCYLCYSNYIL